LLLVFETAVLKPNSVTANPTYLLNIDKLGRGYDLIKGNPDPTHGNGIDPGFRYPIFNLTVYEGTVTSDHRYYVPKGVDINSIFNCHLNFDTSIIYGAQSYSNSLRKKVVTEFSGWGASFKASVDFKEINEGSNRDESVFTKSAAYCEVYQASVKHFLPPPLSEEFKIAVSSLKTPYNSQNPGAYLHFLDYFGTHFFHSVRLGSKFGQQSEIKNTSWDTLTKSSLNIEVSAGYSAFGVSAAVSVMTEEQKSMARSFSHYTNKQHIYSIGKPIPADGKELTWGSSCITDPQVVYYELGVISDLLKPEFFPKDPQINDKKKNLVAALHDYCNQLKKQGKVKDCDDPHDPERFHDKAFGGFYQVDECSKNNVVNGFTGSLSCPRGYTAVKSTCLRTPESRCGANQFYCVDKSAVEKGTFGGTYQINRDTGWQKLPNQECGGGYCCPKHKRVYEFEQVYHPEDRQFSTVFICLGDFIPGKSQIGGFYQKPDYETPHFNVFNPFTGGPSCPPGYHAIQIGSMQVPDVSGEGKGAKSYICILK
jgi:hypothetical protein